MILRLTQVIFIFACALSSAAANAQEQAPVKPVAPVNNDDPNLAYSPDYASDSAVTCPKTLKGDRLRQCLIKNGLASSDGGSEAPEASTNDTSHSFH